MDIEDFLYYLKRKGIGKKAFKIMFVGCLFVAIIIIIFVAIVAILALKYHTQIYDGFMRTVNYIFGDSPDNVLRNFLKQIADNYLKNLFSGE